jgi:hypothetical protein
MAIEPLIDDATAKLREVMAQLTSGIEAHDVIIPARDQVIGRFGELFALERIPQLSAEEFKSFLVFKNNRHWTGLNRHQESMCQDVPKLRRSLGLLVDESQAIDERLTKALSMIPGMGRALATALLLVIYPDKYGVWNNTSEMGLKAVDLWPRFERGATTGQRYVEVNQVLRGLAMALGIDLWTLDALWWAMLDLEKAKDEYPTTMEELVDSEQRFGLERHLHDFLRDNWARTEFGSGWTLEVDEGEPEAGYEYPTSIGRIDLLAKRRDGQDYLVIELKRGQTSDETVGQVLRYMGWVQENLLEPGAEVRGLIIAHGADERIRYALKRAGDVDLKLYQVEFHLLDPLELLPE